MNEILRLNLNKMFCLNSDCSETLDLISPSMWDIHISTGDLVSLQHIIYGYGVGSVYGEDEDKLLSDINNCIENGFKDIVVYLSTLSVNINKSLFVYVLEMIINNEDILLLRHVCESFIVNPCIYIPQTILSKIYISFNLHTNKVKRKIISSIFMCANVPVLSVDIIRLRTTNCDDIEHALSLTSNINFNHLFAAVVKKDIKSVFLLLNSYKVKPNKNHNWLRDNGTEDICMLLLKFGMSPSQAKHSYKRVHSLYVSELSNISEMCEDVCGVISEYM